MKKDFVTGIMIVVGVGMIGQDIPLWLNIGFAAVLLVGLDIRYRNLL